MRTLLKLSILLLFPFAAFSQADVTVSEYRIWNQMSVGKQSTSPATRSDLWLEIGKDNTLRGFGLPRTETGLITSPQKGNIIYSITDKVPVIYNGTAWDKVVTLSTQAGLTQATFNPITGYLQLLRGSTLPAINVPMGTQNDYQSVVFNDVFGLLIFTKNNGIKDTIDLASLAGGGTYYSFLNGIIKDGSIVKMGGEFAENTTIKGNNKYFNLDSLDLFYTTANKIYLNTDTSNSESGIFIPKLKYSESPGLEAIAIEDGKLYRTSLTAGSTPTDTTHLSDRINLKLNISDTSGMLFNYRHWLAGYLSSVDTSNIANFHSKVRSLFSAGYGLTYTNGLFKSDTSILFPAVRLTIPVVSTPTIDQVLQQLDNSLYGTRQIDVNQKTLNIVGAASFRVASYYSNDLIADTLGHAATGTGRIQMGMSDNYFLSNYYGLKLKTSGIRNLYFDVDSLQYSAKRLNSVLVLSDSTTGLMKWKSPQDYAALLSPYFITTIPTLQQVTDAGNTTTNTIELGSVDPTLSLKQATSNQQYILRVGVGTGTSSQVFNIYNQSAGKHVITGGANRVIIGNPTDAFSSSTLYVKGYGANGSNLDVQPDSSILDEGNIEIMASDYGLGQGIALRQWGNVGAASTVMGYQKRNMGVLDFTNDVNIIRTNTNHSLRFGTNNIERMVLDSNGNLSIVGTIRSNSLTAGRLPFITTDGKITDASTGTFDGTYLNVPQVIVNAGGGTVFGSSFSNSGYILADVTIAATRDIVLNPRQAGGTYGVGIGTDAPDSGFHNMYSSHQVGNAKFDAKIHAPNLPTGLGTKAVRWDATNGFVLADTTTGGSGSTVTGGSFNPDDNYLTLNQSGAGNIGIRMRPSYIINDDTSPDSTGVKVNDSTYRTKSITVAASNSKVTVTPARTTKNNTFSVTVNEANFSGIPQTAVSNLADSLNKRMTGTVRIGTSVYDKFSDGSKTFAYYDSLGSGTGGGSRLFIKFEVDVTSYAPGIGDSILKHTYLSSRKALVYREGILQEETSQVIQSHDSLKFIPVLTANERIFIELIDTSNVTMVALEDNSTPPSSDEPIFDPYSSIAIAGYSLRRLKTGQDSCVRIRRSSDDTYQIIGFLSTGFLDTASFKTFVGAGTGYVQTWYNPIDHALDAIKNTASEQPVLQLNVFGNIPAVIFDGSNDALDIDANAAYETTTLFAVDSVGVGAGGENGHFFYYSSAASEGYYPFVNEGIYDAFASTTRKTCGTPSTAIRSKHLYYARSEPGTWQDYINNGLHYSVGTNTGNTTSDMFIGTGGGGKYFNGAISEILVMQDISRATISSNINSFYSIY